MDLIAVDDSPTSLRFVAETLRGAGFQVRTARDGEEAIAMATDQPPDVMVLDILLPKKNGFQVCREIKTDLKTQGIKVILLSSKSQESDRFWGQRQGADAYITKPIQPGELTAIIHAVLSESNLTSTETPNN